MAGFDAVKELLIRIGVLGGDAARAEIDATSASVEKMGAAGKDAGAASQTSAAEQAAALKTVEDSLARAAVVQTNWAASVKSGASQGALAQTELVRSIATVETAISKARAIGAVVPESSIKSLNDMKAALAGATQTVAPHVAAVAASGKAHADHALQVALAKEQLGGWAKAIGVATESTNPLVSGLAKFLLPLAAAAAGLVLFNKAATELSARGVDITSLGDRMSGVWDSVAQALGGTSKATAAASDAMINAESKMEDLDATQRSYGTGLDLIAGLSLDAAKATNVFEGSLGEINVAVTGFEAQASNAVGSIDTLNRAFNTIATLSPQRAAGYRAEFAALVTAAQSGSQESITALQNFQATVTKVAAEVDAKMTAIAKAEGLTAAGAVEFAKAQAQMSAGATNAAVGLETLRKAGETQYESYNKLKGPIEAVLAFYLRYPAALSALDGPQKAVIQGLLEEAKAHSGVTAEEEKHAAKISELRGKYAEVVGAINDSSSAYGNRRSAIAALLPQIDAEIAALEKERAANRGLDPEQERILEGYKRRRAELTLTTAEQDKANQSALSSLKAQHDISKSYEDLTAARLKDKASIEEHRQKFVDSMEAELAKAIAAGDAQVKALDAQHKAMEISDSEYFQSVNEIFAQEAAARRAALDAEDKANEEAAQREKEHQKIYEEKAGELAAAAEKMHLTFEELKQDQAAYDAKVTESLSKARGEWDLTTTKVSDHAAEYPKLAIAWTSFESTVVAGSANINASIDGMNAKMDALIAKLAQVDSASSAAFSSGGGGGTEQFGPPTPAPQPTGSAPGSEFEV